jgi:mRNA interferase HigB
LHPNWEHFIFATSFMRIIAVKILKLFWEEHPLAEQPLKAWFAELQDASFANHNELKSQFGSASIINSKRVVFNIHGNRFRLIVDIEYRFQIIFIVWLGTHSEYDKINVENVQFKKSN